MHCRLSYVVATRNRLPFLSATLPMLIDARQVGEEIIVIDGASTDGTVEYVRELHERGDVDVFLSEPDVGEAHALNKGCLLASGDLIKIVSDDDVFCFEAIRACRDYMLEHPEVDLMAGNVGHVAAESPAGMSVVWDYANEHRRFRQGLIERFTFNGLPLMLRRTEPSAAGPIRDACGRSRPRVHPSRDRHRLPWLVRPRGGPTNRTWGEQLQDAAGEVPRRASATEGLLRLEAAFAGDAVWSSVLAAMGKATRAPSNHHRQAGGGHVEWPTRRGATSDELHRLGVSAAPLPFPQRQSCRPRKNS